MSETKDLATIRVTKDEDGSVGNEIVFADWLDTIPPKEAHELLLLAQQNFESASMPYYFRSLGPGGDKPKEGPA